MIDRPSKPDSKVGLRFRPALAGRNRNPTLLSGLLARSILVQPFVMLPDFPAAGKRFCRKVIHTIHRCSQTEAFPFGMAGLPGRVAFREMCSKPIRDCSCVLHCYPSIQKILSL